MERKDDGYFISNEELKQTTKILGYVGLGVLILGTIRAIIWGPVVRIAHE